MELRKIKAKFESKCLKCEGLTLTGSTVYWEKNRGVYHEKCAPKGKPEYVLTAYCNECNKKLGRCDKWKEDEELCLDCKFNAGWCFDCNKHPQVVDMH